MNCKLQIRKMEAGDREAYLRLAADFYASSAVSHEIPTVNFVDSFHEMMAESPYIGGYMFFADGAAAGYAVIAKTYSTEAGGLVIWAEEIFVQAQYRSHGFGRLFFDTLEREYAGCIRRMRLEIMGDNLRAKELYRRIGFAQTPYLQMMKEYDPEAANNERR